MRVKRHYGDFYKVSRMKIHFLYTLFILLLLFIYACVLFNKSTNKNNNNLSGDLCWTFDLKANVKCHQVELHLFKSGFLHEEQIKMISVVTDDIIELNLCRIQNIPQIPHTHTHTLKGTLTGTRKS